MSTGDVIFVCSNCGKQYYQVWGGCIYCNKTPQQQLDALTATIAQKDAEIERLRKALKEIWDLTHNKQRIRLIDALIEIDIVIKQVLEEVNND